MSETETKQKIRLRSQYPKRITEEETKFSKDQCDEIFKVVLKQYETADKFRQTRLQEIQDLEDTLDSKTKPTLRGRLNIPFASVVANGFVETLVSQVNKPPKIEFSDPSGAHERSVRKVNSAFDYDSSSSRGKWKGKDRTFKRNLAKTNIAIYQFWAESDPEYKSHLKVRDHLDFLCEPFGGATLEEHDYYGLTNNFVSDSGLTTLASNYGYDETQITALKTVYNSDDFKKAQEDEGANKFQRLAKSGLDIEQGIYAGQAMYNLTWWYMTWEGKRLYVVFDRRANTWLKVCELKEMFESDLWPTVVVNAKEDQSNLWTRGYLDTQMPIFHAMEINLNEILNNVRKRNWDMKIVDKRFISDLSQLDYRQDGTVLANVPANSRLSDGIYYVQTPDVNIAVNLVEYLNNFSGINSGISDQTKGASSQDILGIAKLDEINVSKRIKIVSDSYQDGYEQLVTLWLWGIYEHLTEKFFVKFAGARGSEWDEMKKEDFDPEYTINIVSRSDELIEMEDSKKRKAESLERISRNPNLMKVINAVWLLEQELKQGGWDDDDFQRAKDTQNNISDEEVQEARRGIEMILEGKEPDIYRDASLPFVDYIDRFMKQKTDLSDRHLTEIQKYFERHLPIVEKNEQRKSDAMMREAQLNQLGMGTGAEPTLPAEDPNLPLA